jgi:hypothetical protein
MVSITDLWKASGSPSSYRTDKWIKSNLVQAKLQDVALLFGDEVEKDTSGKITGIPGVLEIVRGGLSQGTFTAYSLALDYTEMLSDEVHQWFTSSLGSLSGDDSAILSDSSLEILPFLPGDFGGEVRFTDDGRVSVYDAIGFTTGHKNPRQVWNDLIERDPLFVQKTDKYKFPGRGGAARPTPVASLQVFLEILVTLPGKIAAAVREQAVSTLIRAMQGDPSLAQEIIERIHRPHDLVGLEGFIRIKRTQSEPLIGSLDAPLSKSDLTKAIKTGYGWRNKVSTMVDLLVKLATYAGEMVIERDIPCRSLDEAGKSKSRRIPLSIKVLKNLSVLHIFHFDTTYIDDADVSEICQVRAYPELALRDEKGRGIECVVTHLVSPGGITVAGVERLKEMQTLFDDKYSGRIRLSAMRLSELVWEFMYPTIQERYRDERGKFGSLHLGEVKKVCNALCQNHVDKPAIGKPLQPQQLSLLGELLSDI